MRRLHTFMFIVLAVTTVLAQADAAQTLPGRWEGQRPAESRVDNVALVFARTDKGLTGEAWLNGKLFDTLTEIKAAGTNVTFNMSDLNFTATLRGTSMEITAHFDGRDLWTMTLTKKDAPR
ncbi:MAG TPA: hypothetical protein VJN96_03865 [Vicinamibacterales bacterium]|nr:hypothetical protein [Vicinamibacterales bacterium]